MNSFYDIEGQHNHSFKEDAVSMVKCSSQGK